LVRWVDAQRNPNTLWNHEFIGAPGKRVDRGAKLDALDNGEDYGFGKRVPK
jgi:hypothetical protein